MAKKRVSVYMREDDFEWLSKYPIAESASGSAVLIMEWTMAQVKKGLSSALQKLDENEQRAVVACTAPLQITSNYTPMMLAAAVNDWFADDPRATEFCWGSGDEILEFYHKCQKMTPAEVMGLLSWAKGKGNS